MAHRVHVALASLLAAFPASSSPARVYALVNAPGGPIKAPLFAPDQAALPIAQVGARTVTLSELAAAVSATHEKRVEPAARKRKDFTPLLDRLIGVRLVVQEAEAMGLDELDAVKEDLARYRDTALREQIQRLAVAGVKADPAEVERIFREATREWKLKSALFAKEEDARAVAQAARAGQSFDQLIARAVAEKKAEGGSEAQYFSARMRMLPPVLEAVRKLKPGEVSGALPVEKGFALVRVEAIRHPWSAAARKQAQEKALTNARSRALRARYDGLLRRYARTDEKLLAQLDFEAARPGFAALEKDPRALVTLEGDKPVTVADLAAEIRAAFFHDVDNAIRSRKVNVRKAQVLDALVSRRLVKLEAARLGIEKTAAYRKAVSDHRDQLLFSAFVGRVILPDLKVTPEDLRRYYDQHKAEFTYPTFFTLQSLAFASQDAAQAALRQLRSGADFKWVRANAEGQLPPGKEALSFDGNTVSAGALPDEVGKALAGAQTGDLRLMEAAGQSVVLVVAQVTPPATQPFAEARETVAAAVQNELLDKSLGDWIVKLRKAHQVKVFITRIVS